MTPLFPVDPHFPTKSNFTKTNSLNTCIKHKGKKQMAAKLVPPPSENLSSGTQYSNFHLKFDTSIPIGYLPVCICTGFPSYIGYISLSSTFSSFVNYGSTKEVVYADKHVKRNANGQFFYEKLYFTHLGGKLIFCH